MKRRAERAQIDGLREEIDRINEQMLRLLNRRARAVDRVREYKESHGLPMYDPEREAQQIERLLLKNKGPMGANTVEGVFKELFRQSLSEMEVRKDQGLLVTRRSGRPLRVSVDGVRIGGGRPVLIAGPCAVESEELLDRLAATLAGLDVKIMRGGAFKPRSSPYTFQGLGMEGVRILSRVAHGHGLKVVSELTDPCILPEFLPHVDMIQVGARNMFNYDMLKKVAGVDKPILLKRSFAATVEELYLAAEYLFSGGNRKVVLCERGIRTFETATRNTLDVSAVGLVKSQTDLPIIVDVSHAAGRKDLLVPLARAALAAGADGIMVEVHPFPQGALSDGSQQMNIEEFKRFCEALDPFMR